MHSSNNILLIKPANFGYNTETAISNAFQKRITEDSEISAQKAVKEFETMSKKLSERGINVLILEDSKNPIKPDAIFPNNWGSFHSDGTVVLYPMLAKNRRAEKRKELLESIQESFVIKKIIDLSKNEDNDIFLEGTGSIIFDHNDKIAYACIAPRTNKELFIETIVNLGYKPIYFHSYDKLGKAIYHTNVMMNIGNGYAVICMDSITDNSEKQLITESINNSGKELITISFDQMSSFCGNMIELETQEGKNILAMSQSAYSSLTLSQIGTLEKYCELFPLKVDTIEKIGGGSVRCMISELFLPKKNESTTKPKLY